MSEGNSEAPAANAIRVLVVDNDEAHAQAMEESLTRSGYPCTVATSGPSGASHIEKEVFDVIITDLVMNEVDGMDLLARGKEALPDCEVIMVTGHATVPKAVEAMQQGAFNFLEKPITPNRLRAVVERAADAVNLKRRNLELHQRLDERFGFEGIVYKSEKMQKVIERVKRLAPTDARVFIAGESGTGKELIAQALHQNSPRKGKRIVALNARAVSEQLVESELFGHVKGAFTDARNDRVGAFEYANGGSIFFDEVGDMPMSTQIKLLRVLEDHVITRVGDNKPIQVNVRVISATNKRLEDLVEQGEFRNDLYYRLKVVTIELPPLRDRREDIAPLVDHFRKSFAKKGSRAVKMPTPDVMRRFFAYDWPGNVRELRNVIENMIIMDTDGVLDVDDLPPDMDDIEEAAVISDGPSSLVGRPLSEIERWAIEETLKLTNGNREEAARMLGIGNRTIYRKIKDYGLQDSQKRTPPPDEAGENEADAD